MVCNTLKDCGIAPYSIHETVGVIMKDGYKVFAILVVIRKVQCISKFIEHDQFQDPGTNGLDSRLPFSENTIESFLGITRFFEVQWEFVVPIFFPRSIHRSLHADTVLPYIQEEELSEGGFGVIYKVTLHSSHQRLPLPFLEEVCKKKSGKVGNMLILL